MTACSAATNRADISSKAFESLSETSSSFLDMSWIVKSPHTPSVCEEEEAKRSDALANHAASVASQHDALIIADAIAQDAESPLPKSMSAFVRSATDVAPETAVRIT